MLAPFKRFTTKLIQRPCLRTYTSYYIQLRSLRKKIQSLACPCLPPHSVQSIVLTRAKKKASEASLYSPQIDTNEKRFQNRQNKKNTNLELFFTFLLGLLKWNSCKNLVNKASCRFAFDTFKSISQLKTGIYSFTTQYYTYLSLSVFSFFLFFPITSFRVFRVVDKKNPTNNKLLKAMWRRGTRMLGMNEWRHTLRPCTWLLSRALTVPGLFIKTLKLFPATPLGRTRAKLGTRRL